MEIHFFLFLSLLTSSESDAEARSRDFARETDTQTDTRPKKHTHTHTRARRHTYLYVEKLSASLRENLYFGIEERKILFALERDRRENVGDIPVHDGRETPKNDDSKCSDPVFNMHYVVFSVSIT